jgi:hypothetical protein
MARQRIVAHLDRRAGRLARARVDNLGGQQLTAQFHGVRLA